MSAQDSADSALNLLRMARSSGRSADCGSPAKNPFDSRNECLAFGFRKFWHSPAIYFLPELTVSMRVCNSPSLHGPKSLH